MMKGLGDMSPDGRRDGRTQRRLYAPPKFFGEHKKCGENICFGRTEVKQYTPSPSERGYKYSANKDQRVFLFDLQKCKKESWNPWT